MNEMNIKQLLIEKERAAYLNNDTDLATFLASTLDYVISLEEQVNKSDAEVEELCRDYEGRILRAKEALDGS